MVTIKINRCIIEIVAIIHVCEEGATHMASGKLYKLTKNKIT